MLQQAGSLTTNAALRSLAPTFAELLKKDHDSRRRNINSNIDNYSSISSSNSIYSNNSLLISSNSDSTIDSIN